jgi:predicted esterase YcpF (UPF0227 family)
MPTLLYIHGFLSSPQSFKAQAVETWLAKYRPDISYYCPQLPPYPDECAEILENTLETILEANLKESLNESLNESKPVYLVGSSMGGFWTTYFSEKYDLKSVIINPAVNVLELMPKYANQTLVNYHHDTEYVMTEEHLSQLKKYVIEQPQALQNYWLLAQKADETLDYRLAVDKYNGCRQTVEEGGDHSFQGFEKYIPEIIQFLES